MKGRKAEMAFINERNWHQVPGVERPIKSRSVTVEEDGHCCNSRHEQKDECSIYGDEVRPRSDRRHPAELLTISSNYSFKPDEERNQVESTHQDYSSQGPNSCIVSAG